VFGSWRKPVRTEEVACIRPGQVKENKSHYSCAVEHAPSDPDCTIRAAFFTILAERAETSEPGVYGRKRKRR
jgi:hypothetical protein